MWIIVLSPRAEKALRKLDRQVAKRVHDILVRFSSLDDPAKSRKALTGPLTGLWRHRVGEYRVIIAVDLGHRGDIYD